MPAAARRAVSGLGKEVRNRAGHVRAEPSPQSMRMTCVPEILGHVQIDWVVRHCDPEMLLCRPNTGIKPTREAGSA